MHKFTLTFAFIPSFSHTALAFKASFSVNNAIATTAFEPFASGKKSDGLNILSPFFHLINASKLLTSPLFISISG